MSDSPQLSIVVPTRPGVAEWWIQSLTRVEGAVEFILVHPPGMRRLKIADSRVTEIVSPLRGEVVQRMTGLLSASGRWVLSLNCDECVHPDVLRLSEAYFTRFPQSWVMRLNKRHYPYGAQARLTRPWPSLPNVSAADETGVGRLFRSRDDLLVPIPISPMDKRVDLLSLVRGRKNHHGLHVENFDKRVWRNDPVQAALTEMTSLLLLAGPLKYVPFWTLDRFLSLYIQAKFYEPGRTIGHRLPPQDEQIRMENNPPQYPRTGRFYLSAEILLLRRFPRYGYIWDLILGHVHDYTFGRAIALIKRLRSGSR